MLAFERVGAQQFAGALNPSQVEHIRSLFGGGSQPGKRLVGSDLQPLAKMLALRGVIGRIAAGLIGSNARPVRALLLDKSPLSNWRLGWHQDRTISIKERIEVEGFGPWSVKAGQFHVQPPHSITERMVTLRVHADDVDEENAPLLVLPGSHTLGRLSNHEVERLAQDAEPMMCEANAGDVWAYRTAIVHASAEQRKSARRRVLQLDYAAEGLPGGLQWVELLFC